MSDLPIDPTPVPPAGSERPAGRPVKAVALLSGGLDSTLAVKMLQEQGIEVHALNFNTGFCLTDHARKIRKTQDVKKLRNEALRAGADLDVEVEIVDISQEYLEILTKPKHGYGSGANPCIDCRAFMLKKAREHMEAIGADFVATGEVLGQRPMSQMRPTMDLIERESGLKGKLLRPLSAKHLPPTEAEKAGLIDRERLGDVRGRSRAGQISLAEKLKITDYPQPAGGCCFLTDENYASKFHDFMAHWDGRRELRIEDFLILKVGRHFRLNPGLRCIVGRMEGENHFLAHFGAGHWLLTTPDVMGPTTWVDGEPAEDELATMARLTVRYSDCPPEASTRVHAIRDEETRELDRVPRMPVPELETYRIQ
jgi:tRNA U34 2-thiouridine synthase MnmA/TrmU